MSGFVTGQYTLFVGLKQLEPSSILYIPSKGPINLSRRIFKYLPTDYHSDSLNNLQEQLASCIDHAIDRTIKAVGDAPVWVPLSGGLDSRLVLAKLKARGCKNLYSFSYGPKGNDDAVIAKSVAKRLSVPWKFVPISGSEARTFFSEPRRHKYWRFADGLSSVPNNQDILPLIKLRDSAALADNSVIINGQTGDFISGGHIPERLFDSAMTVGSFLEAILDRHYSLWKSLLTPQNLDIVAPRIRKILSLDGSKNAPLNNGSAIALWEQFEYETRQAKYIVNGQRCYDFLGLRWMLPLWDGKLVEFWRNVPPTLKREQSLYRSTWQVWNYKGTFSKITRPVTAWSRPVSSVVVPLSIAARLLCGRSRRDRWINYARYFDRFGTHYQTVGWRKFVAHAHDARNSTSLYAKVWLKENHIPWPQATVSQ